MAHQWISKRTEHFDSSGIRKVFDLAANLENPINLSIGQPDFDVPKPVRDAMIDAVEGGKNGYALTQGVPALREKLQQHVSDEYRHDDRRVFVTSGTSGGLVLVMQALVDPGDEVIIFDPYFVEYEPLVQLVGGTPVIIDTHPDFQIDLDRVESAITDRTKLIVLNSPSNPTGVVPDAATVRGLAELAARKHVALVSDEIYQLFCYDQPFVSPARFNPDTIVVDGFSKTYAMTGWRVGFAHGPSAVIEAMTKVQQYTFVCAPQPAQWAGVAAMDVDMSSHVDAYRRKRDLIIAGLQDDFEIVKPGGAFYVYPKVPGGTATEFVARAIENNVLIIPGNVFSQHDTHFRISYAAADDVLERGIDVLCNLARG
ncbi:MAG: aminotransferase class I/II-fold pyridoxal phosphate-dependent enzyme [Pirellulales bacterium]|nr:aminotransferase class I/II-fold pyridoxal phosphate-dependent enzyme [Pirellulales bacterium]